MLRQHQLPIDYQHIKIYGAMCGHTPEYVRGQQWLAHKANAPHDTFEITSDQTPLRFRDLPTIKKREFINDTTHHKA
ncbi:hypothetical protein KAR91_18060 [Candidatus Pacearchaeota archaeon]|nr:hypothetical protein [Candidatus Pacearchaeota archaeon]